MNQRKNKYRYLVTTRLEEDLLTEPLGEAEFKMEWERQDEEELDYNKTLPSQVLFTGHPYQSLLKLEGSIYRCEQMFITVQRRCLTSGVETWLTWYTGTFSLNEADWDLDRCEVKIKLDENNASKCWEDGKSAKVDLLGLIPGANRVVVLANPPNVTIQKTIASKSGSSSGLISRYAWNVNSPFGPSPEEVGFTPYQNDYSNNGTTWSTTTFWARLVLTLTCADPEPIGDWIPLTNTCPGGNKTYARPVSLYDCEYSNPQQFVGQVNEGELMICKIVGDVQQVYQFKNGMKLSDCLDAIMDTICPGLTVVSDFFQINPENVSTTNYVTGQASKTMDIVVFQKSDVKRPTSASATKAETTPEKFMTAMVNMWNIRWRIIGSDFRIEHVSFWEQPEGFDLTTSQYLVGMRGYTYETPKIPQREEFTFMESVYGSDFQGRPIIYSGGCVSKESKSNVTEYPVEIVTTDVLLAVSNSSGESKVVSDEGFVFMATYRSGSTRWIITEEGILRESQLNNSLGFAQLHRDYWRWDRPLKSGTMNDQVTTFFSVKKLKKGKTIQIPLCCTDTFNPDAYITTPLGIATVSKASFSFKSEMLELDLLYSADAGLVGNLPPVANNDVKNLYEDQLVVIDVLANDYDDVSILTIEITTNAIHGLAQVTPDLKIEYLPNLGYNGDDYFNYRILDEWNEPSNIALVALNIYPTNTPPVANNDTYNTTMGISMFSVAAPGVFANDTDSVGFVLDTYTPTTSAGGTVQMFNNGSFNYTPPSSGYYGADTWTYTIIDDQGLTDTATVTINVINPNFPIAVDDHYQIKSNTTLTLFAPGVMANDINPLPGSLTCTAQSMVTPHGGATINSNGSLTYNPTTNYVGQDQFNYGVNNSAGGDTGTVFVDVLPIIWIKLTKYNNFFGSLTNICNGNSQPGGSFARADFRLNFYANAGGTIPFDITGHPFHIFITQGFRDTPSGAFTYTTEEINFTPAGTVALLADDFITQMNAVSCSGQQFYYDITLQLASGLYSIIP